jgi:hypothetical protein
MHRFPSAMTVIILAASYVHAAEMDDLAKKMEPGTWAELKTAGIVEVLRAKGASGAIFGYSEDGAWDPESRSFYYLGGDHGDTPRFVRYSTDAWVYLYKHSESGAGAKQGSAETQQHGAEAKQDIQPSQTAPSGVLPSVAPAAPEIILP